MHIFFRIRSCWHLQKILTLSSAKSWSHGCQLPAVQSFLHVAAVVVSDSLDPVDSAARQASQCLNISQSLLRLRFIEPGMPSNRLILFCPLLVNL